MVATLKDLYDVMYDLQMNRIPEYIKDQEEI